MISNLLVSWKSRLKKEGNLDIIASDNFCLTLDGAKLPMNRLTNSILLIMGEYLESNRLEFLEFDYLPKIFWIITRVKFLYKFIKISFLSYPNNVSSFIRSLPILIKMYSVRAFKEFPVTVSPEIYRFLAYFVLPRFNSGLLIILLITMVDYTTPFKIKFLTSAIIISYRTPA